MAEHGDVLVFHGATDPGGHLVFGQGEDVVDRGDAVIELREDGVVEVQRAVLQDVHLGAGEELEAGVSGVERADAFDLGKETFLVEPAGLEGGLRVVGDAEILHS